MKKLWITPNPQFSVVFRHLLFLFSSLLHYSQGLGQCEERAGDVPHSPRSKTQAAIRSQKKIWKQVPVRVGALIICAASKRQLEIQGQPFITLPEPSRERARTLKRSFFLTKT